MNQLVKLDNNPPWQTVPGNPGLIQRRKVRKAQRVARRINRRTRKGQH